MNHDNWGSFQHGTARFLGEGEEHGLQIWNVMYIERAIANSRQEVVLEQGGWSEVENRK